MITDEIKANINKIDYSLKKLFENVYIKELSIGNKFFFEIRANSTFFNINESNEWKRAESIVIIDKKDLNGNVVHWKYSINPLKESSTYIDRSSHIDNIANDIYETITKSRMEKEYLNGLETIVEYINESVEEEITKDDLIDKLKEISNKYINVETVSVSPIIKENTYFSKPDMVARIYHNNIIDISDKFKIESEFATNEGVNWTLFKEGFIEVNYSLKK